MLGWKIGVSNFIFGGMSGYSGGKDRRARKNPPKVVSVVYQPLEIAHTSIIFAVIIHHEHNFPLEDIIVH
jgi:hypothetical protein